MQHTWTDEQIRRLHELEKEHTAHRTKWNVIAQTLTKEFDTPFRPEQCRNRFRYSVPETAVDKGEYYTREEKSEQDTLDDHKELWEWQQLKCKKAIADEERKRHHDIWFKKEEPFYLVFVSDQHIGASHCDMERMRSDQELIKNTPNTFQIWGGDSIDNHIKHIGAIINRDKSPSDQMRLLNYLLSIAGDKILAVISGNHEYWTRTFSGLDYLDLFMGNHNIKFNNHEMFLSIYLGGVEYRVAVRHQFRYESSFNVGHAVKQYWRMGQWDFDVGVLCHKHVGTAEPFYGHGVQKWALRPGSYQINSGFTTQYGYNDASPTMPGVKIFPDKKKIIGFPDFKEFINGSDD